MPTLTKPEWLKIRPPAGEQYRQIKSTLRDLRLHTVCEEAHCPNVAECWQGGTATFMVLGDVCTRGCRFCTVKSGNPHGLLDPEEPAHLANAVSAMGLKYVVITTVDRDDLPDGGARHFTQCVQAVRQSSPGTLIELLTGDFGGNRESLATLLTSKPAVLAHNLETVERLTPMVRDRRAAYRRSLEVLAESKRLAPSIYTKSSLMAGLGETEAEVRQALEDLRAHAVDIVTFGQYLQPSAKHLPVSEYVTPEIFDRYRVMAEGLGFLYAASGPLVRSSYRAGELFVERLIRRGGQSPTPFHGESR